jgi:signal transduction histidine kinase
MRKVTTRTRLALNLSVLVFALLFTTIVGFIFLLRVTLESTLSNNLATELTEILDNYILYNNEKSLVFTEDDAGRSLAEELQDHNYSALFLDNNLSYVKGFGAFEFYNADDEQTVQKIVELSSQSANKHKIIRTKLPWKDKSFLVIVSPLVKDNDLYGVIVLSQSLDQVQTLINSTLFLSLGLLVFVLIGSFAISSFIVGKALTPIKDLSKHVETIDLDRLDKKVDISGHERDEIVILAKKFNEMLLRLKAMSELQKEFVSNASHELKTPLTKTISSVELLSYKNPKIATDLNTIKIDLFSINSLLNDLLNLSRQNKNITQDTGFVNLKTMLETLIGKFSSEIKEKGLIVNLVVSKNATLYFPIKYLEILFSNIISNAIKFSNNYGKINILAYKKTNKTIVSVEDFGVGMNEGEKEKVFSRFYRAKDSKNTKGSGIGLSLVKRICDLYGVNIRIDSQEGEGTKVIIEFS